MDEVVFVVVMTILRYDQLGFRWITMILDNARTHGHDMETAVRTLLLEIVDLYGWEDLKRTTVEFRHTPPYSPAFTLTRRRSIRRST